MPRPELLAVIAVLACASTAETGQTRPEDRAEVRAPSAIALVNVRVVTMLDARILENRTVVVRDGAVESVLAASATPPADAVVIDGAGRYLAPALIDMHVHVRSTDLLAYLMSGVGTVRNMWGHSGVRPLVRAIDEGTTLGPQVFSTGPGLDGNPPQWPETQLVGDSTRAAMVVDSLASSGWRVMKVYQSLGMAAYDAIMSAVRSRGITAVGHVPTAVPIQHALDAGQRSIEHLTGYDRAMSRQGRIGTWGWVDVDTSMFASLARATARAGTWNCPTLAIYVKLTEQHPPAERPAIVANRRRFLLELSRAEAPLIAGTDAGIGVVAPGTSMHDELAEWVRAGLTPFQALRAATADAGRFLGAPGLGTIANGSPAYLVLLEGNPLGDVANARRVSGVVVRGEWFSIGTLRERAR